ncbi:MAG TPA: type II toxin-antitoxin system HicA family toxin [Abditibacteriaceae bacterium]
MRKILEANGFVFDRQNGSHMILVMRTDDDSKTVSVPDHKELSIGTLGGIIRESGLSRALFE